VAHASQLRQSLADAISTFSGSSEASAATAPKEPPSAAARRDLGNRIATAP